MNASPLEVNAGGKTSPEEAQAQMRRLGLRRIVVPIPFEEEGPVNVFVLENGPELGGVTLFDTGVLTPEGQAALDGGLTALGLEARDVRRVVVSHGHLDHLGNAHRFPEATLHVHPGDRAKLVPDPAAVAGLDRRWRGLYRALGLSDGAIDGLERRRRWLETMQVAPPADRVRDLADGERLAFAQVEAEVLHVPGHTPGLCVLWFADAGVMLTADHLLQHTSPNPVMEPGPGGPGALGGKDRSLVRYLESLARVRALPIRWVAPGHGPLFEGADALIDRLLGFYDRRQDRLVDFLRAHPGASTREVAAEVFARAYDKALFLVLSEVLGNLEVLAGLGRIRGALDDADVLRWWADVGAPG